MGRINPSHSSGKQAKLYKNFMSAPWIGPQNLHSKSSAKTSREERFLQIPGLDSKESVWVHMHSGAQHCPGKEIDISFNKTKETEWTEHRRYVGQYVMVGNAYSFLGFHL